MSDEVFDVNDYSFWLMPMQQISMYPDYPFGYKRKLRIKLDRELTESFLKMGWITTSVTFVFWIVFMMLARFQKQRWGHAHSYITIWIIIIKPAPVIFKLISNL